MHDSPMSKQIRYIKDNTEMKRYLQELEASGIDELAVDIEGEFNLHRYGEHLCLVQIFHNDNFTVVDPLSTDIQLIKQFFEMEKMKKLVYDCTSDRTLLFRRYDIRFTSPVDLVPAVELLELEKKGLNSVLSSVLGMEQKPKKKFQRYDWMRRPIDCDALEYAVEDVAHLFPLRDKLFQRLEEKGLMEEYQKRLAEVAGRPIAKKGVPGLFKKNRFKRLSSSRQSAMKELFSAREMAAEKMDLPPDRIVPNRVLFDLVCGDQDVERLRFHPRLRTSLARELRQSFQNSMKKIDR